MFDEVMSVRVWLYQVRIGPARYGLVSYCMVRYGFLVCGPVYTGKLEQKTTFEDLEKAIVGLNSKICDKTTIAMASELKDAATEVVEIFDNLVKGNPEIKKIGKSEKSL